MSGQERDEDAAPGPWCWVYKTPLFSPHMAFDSQEDEGQSGLIGGPSTGWRSDPGAWLGSEGFRVRGSEAFAPIPGRRNGLQVEAEEASFRREAEIYKTLDPPSRTTSPDTVLGLTSMSETCTLPLGAGLRVFFLVRQPGPRAPHHVPVIITFWNRSLPCMGPVLSGASSAHGSDHAATLILLVDLRLQSGNAWN